MGGVVRWEELSGGRSCLVDSVASFNSLPPHSFISQAPLMVNYYERN